MANEHSKWNIFPKDKKKTAGLLLAELCICMILASCGRDITSPRNDEILSNDEIHSEEEQAEEAESSGSEESETESLPEGIIPRTYVKVWSDIPAASYEILSEQAVEAVERAANQSSAFNNAEYQLSYSDCEWIDSILLTAEEGVDSVSSSHNGIGFFFHALRLESYSDYPDLGQEKDVCFLIRFRNFYLSEEGELLYDSEIDSAEYESYDQAWRVYVERNAERYRAYSYRDSQKESESGNEPV